MSTPATTEEVKAANERGDAALYDVASRHVLFKPGPIRNGMLDIAEQLLADRIKWGDEFTLSALPSDRNTIGTAFRLLIHAGIISRMEQHRRSIVPSHKSRVVWKYRLVSVEKAKTFMQRNGRTAHKVGQSELAL